MIILRSNIDLSTLTIFAAVCSGLQQIAAVELFNNIILCSSLQQIATVDLFIIDNMIRSRLQQVTAVDLFINIDLYSSMDLSSLTIFAVRSSTELIVNTILRSMIEIILGDPHTMTVA